MSECDVGPCGGTAIVQFTGEAGRSWRTARACREHTQMLANYCAKPVEQWRDDYQLVAVFDHATREWVPVEGARCGGLDPAYPGRSCEFRKGHDGPCIDALAVEG